MGESFRELKEEYDSIRDFMHTSIKLYDRGQYLQERIRQLESDTLVEKVERQVSIKHKRCRACRESYFITDPLEDYGYCDECAGHSPEAIYYPDPPPTSNDNIWRGK